VPDPPAKGARLQAASSPVLPTRKPRKRRAFVSRADNSKDVWIKVADAGHLQRAARLERHEIRVRARDFDRFAVSGSCMRKPACSSDRQAR
jgi:hypothetical protein